MASIPATNGCLLVFDIRYAHTVPTISLICSQTLDIHLLYAYTMCFRTGTEVKDKKCNEPHLHLLYLQEFLSD